MLGLTILGFPPAVVILYQRIKPFLMAPLVFSCRHIFSRPVASGGKALGLAPDALLALLSAARLQVTDDVLNNIQELKTGLLNLDELKEMLLGSRFRQRLRGPSQPLPLFPDSHLSGDARVSKGPIAVSIVLSI